MPLPARHSRLKLAPGLALAAALALAGSGPLRAGLAVPPPRPEGPVKTAALAKPAPAARPEAEAAAKPAPAAKPAAETAAKPAQAAKPEAEAAAKPAKEPRNLRELPADARLSDAETEELARIAMAAADPKEAASILPRLQGHHFKSSTAKERELTLFVQGVLEDRIGKTTLAATTFHKMELVWPRSPYLAEGQVIMAEAAVEHKRWQESESRLHKALAADIPAEARRRAQELLLWTLAEQGRAAEGIPILETLKPLDSSSPTERGLVGIMEALCAARKQGEADATRKEYHRLFPAGRSARRVDLDWAKLLGAMGDAKGAAQRFHALIQESPEAPEADEARLALATLLTDGRLTGKDAATYPTPGSLLAGLQKDNLKDAPARQAALVRLRLALKEARWQEAADLVTHVRSLHPGVPEAATLDGLRAQAVRGWAQELLDRHQAAPLLPYLDSEGIRALTPEQRLGLCQRLAQGGLPEAPRTIAQAAPPAERAALLRAALDGTSSEANPQAALALLPAKGENPREALKRAQASLALHDWPGARTALGRAAPGAERIQGVLAYLERPVTEAEPAEARRQEAEAWLARAPEKGPEREPLAILAADLRARTGDWKGALALYPSAPQPADRGWVALMRATCQFRLGQAAPARESLKLAGDDPAFRKERQALEQQLGKAAK
jgi:hypothetical protein